MPERHKKFVRMLRVRVCLSQFAYDRLVKPAALQLQLPVRKEVLLWFSVWTDMWTLGVLRKQESEGEEAPWLAGLAGRETPPAKRERGGLPQITESQGTNTAAPTREVVAGCAASSHPGLSNT